MGFVSLTDVTMIYKQGSMTSGLSVYHWLAILAGCWPLGSNGLGQRHVAESHPIAPIPKSAENVFSIQSYGRTDFFGNIQGLSLELRSCDVKSIVVISDCDHHSNDLLLFLASSSLLLTHYDISRAKDNQIQEFISNSYVNQSLKNYVLLTNRPGEVISLAEAVFHEHGRGRAALMPHKSTWTVITSSKSQLDNVLEGQIKSGHAFDNVAVWFGQSLGEGPKQAVQVRTLRWGSHKSRRFDLIHHSSLGLGCHSFPNRRLGLNGRTLHALTKFYLFSDMIEAYTDASNSTRFRGLYVDLLHLLAKSLNFSYIITITDVPWKNYSSVVRETKSDIGLTVWRTLGVYSDLDTSYPFVLDYIRGFYMKPKSHRKSYWPVSTTLVFPFPPKAYIIAAVSLILAVLLYSLVDESMPEPSKETSRSNNGISWANSFSEPAASKFNTQSKLAPSHSKAPSISCGRLRDRLLTTLWRFGSSIFKQGYLPNPQRLSLRVHTWSWAMCTLCFATMFTSYLTSAMVKPDDGADIGTFEGLLQRKDFYVLVIQDSDVMVDLQNSNDLVVKRLAQRTLTVDINTVFDQEAMIKITSLMNQNHAFLLFGIFADKFTKMSNLSKRIMFIQERLFQTFFGLAFPQKSELNELISNKIVDLHDAGIMIQTLKRHRLVYTKVETNADDNFETRENSMELHDFLSLFFFILLCIGISVAVLGIECLVFCCRVMTKAASNYE